MGRTPCRAGTFKKLRHRPGNHVLEIGNAVRDESAEVKTIPAPNVPAWKIGVIFKPEEVPFLLAQSIAVPFRR